MKGLATSTIEGCVTVAGTPLPGSRVAVLRLNASGTAVNREESQIITNAGPCPNYQTKMTTFGNWRVAAWRLGTPYESSLPAPTYRTLNSTVAGGTYTVNIDLPATGRLTAHVTDENGAPLSDHDPTFAVLQYTLVPGPGTAVLLLAGLAGLSARRRRGG